MSGAIPMALAHRRAPAAPFRILAEGALALGLAVVVCTAAIQQALGVGRLSVPPMYDDVVYLIAARRWIASLGDLSLGAAIRNLFDQHAPFSTMLGVLGLEATDPSLVGPYAMTALPLAAYFFGVLIMLRALRFAVAGATLVAVGSVPFLSHTATEFRPDLIHGALTGLCAVLLVSRPFLVRDRAGQVGTGTLAGVALLAKPSASPATLALLGAALFLRIALDARRRPAPWRAGLVGDLARAAAWFCLPVIVIAGPTYAIRYAEIFAYVRQTLVTERDLWAYDGSLLDHMRFYANGSGGRLALGPALWVALGTFALRLGAALWRNRADLAALGVLALLVSIAYAIPSVTVVKTYFLGGIFYGTLVTAAAANFVAAWRACAVPVSPRQAWVGTLVVVLVASAWTVQRFYRRPVGLATTLPAQVAENYRTATQRVWAVVRERAAARRTAGGEPLRVTFNSPDPVNASALEFYAVGERLPLAVGALYFARNVDGAVEELPRWDLVVVASSISHPLPGPRMGDELIRILDAHDDFALVDSFAQQRKGVVRIYERRRT